MGIHSGCKAQLANPPCHELGVGYCPRKIMKHEQFSASSCWLGDGANLEKISSGMELDNHITETYQDWDISKPEFVGKIVGFCPCCAPWDHGRWGHNGSYMHGDLRENQVTKVFHAQRMANIDQYINVCFGKAAWQRSPLIATHREFQDPIHGGTLVPYFWPQFLGRFPEI